jgi:hypothetical protein
MGKRTEENKGNEGRLSATRQALKLKARSRRRSPTPGDNLNPLEIYFGSKSATSDFSSFNSFSVAAIGDYFTSLL